MKCPIDGVALVISERQGIEIDYCPVCRGVWLDRGELDKIVERAVPQAPIPARAMEPERPRRRDDDDDDDDRGRDDRGHKKKRRDSFLGELFDF